MINTGLEITFTREGEDYNIQDIFIFSPKGRYGYASLNDIVNDHFKFPFYNLVQNTPFKVTIYNERPTALGYGEFYAREMAKTWITLARVYNAFIRKGCSIPDRISYDPKYVPCIFYIMSHNESYLFFYDYVDLHGNIVSSKADYLIFYPLIFKRDGDRNGYYALNPTYMFKDLVSTMTPYYQDTDREYAVYCITRNILFSHLTPQEYSNYLGLPVYELSDSSYIPNIVPDNFNLDRW